MEVSGARSSSDYSIDSLTSSRLDHGSVAETASERPFSPDELASSEPWATAEAEEAEEAEEAAAQLAAIRLEEDAFASWQQVRRTCSHSNGHCSSHSNDHWPAELAGRLVVAGERGGNGR